MTDQPTPSTDGDPAATPGAEHADETFGWTAEESRSADQAAGNPAERMLGQLQAMIDSIATQAAPVVKQVGAKAAELAAAAADRAGPIAHRAADATAGASVKIAERSREFAADLRRDRDGNGSVAVAESPTEAATDAATDATDEAPGTGDSV